MLGPPAANLVAQELAFYSWNRSVSVTYRVRAMDWQALPWIAGAQLELPNQAGQVVGGGKRRNGSH